MHTKSSAVHRRWISQLILAMNDKRARREFLSLIIMLAVLTLGAMDASAQDGPLTLEAAARTAYQ